MTVTEMKIRRAQVRRSMEALLDTAQKEKRAMNTDEANKFNQYKEEVRSLTDKIDTMTAWLEGEKGNQSPKQQRRFSFVNAIRAMVERRSFDEPEKTIAEIGLKQMEGRSVSEGSLVIPMEKRGALQATLASQGAEDVSTDLLDLVTPLQNELIATKAGCTFLTGLRGNIEVPFYTGATTAWAGEVEEAKDAAGSFKKKSLAPLRISGYVDISRQLLTQANDSVDAFIQADLVESVKQTLESTMLGDGAGSDNQPAGLLNGVTAETAAPTYGKLVDMETALLKNNFTNLSWVGAYDALGTLKQTEKVAGYPVYLLDNGLIDGRPVYGSNNMAAKGLILADFSELTIAQWGGIEILVDPYTQATKASVRLVVNAYFNYFIRRGYDRKGNDILPVQKVILK